MCGSLKRVSALTVMLATGIGAQATEFGQSHADLGYIDTLAGFPLAPGFYIRNDINIQISGRFNNGSADPITLNLGPNSRIGVKFRNTIEADILSGAYVPDWKLPYFNVTVGMAAYEFIANSRAGVITRIGIPEAAATEKAGFGDVTVVPLFLAFDIPNTNFHVVVSPFEFTAPTGRYEKNDPIGNNPGLNYWSYRPALEATYLNKSGQEFSINSGISINSENSATHYRSGSEIYFTWATQQYFSERFAVGIGGYYYKQISNDKRNGQVVDTNTSAFSSDTLGAGSGNKGETFAIGPVVSYNHNNDITFQAHWDHEVFAYNRPQHESLYIRGIMHF